MKRIKFIAMASLIVMAAFSLIVAANAVNVGTQKDVIIETKEVSNNNQLLFFAEISFSLFINDACGCIPIAGASISGIGIDTDHVTSNTTDENGFCTLELEFDATYKIVIEAEGYATIKYNFLIIDDQVFIFYAQEIDDSSSQSFPILTDLLEKIVRKYLEM